MATAHALRAEVAAVRDATGGGVTHAVETVGSARVLAEAYAATRRGGTTVSVGLRTPTSSWSCRR